VALGVAAFVRGTRWYGGLAAVLAILIGIFLPATMAVSPQKVAAGAIQVGDTMPRFEAVDEFGKGFDSASLHGHLLLIKFFRAHW
jgi:cytochrome oxidase Cu insertion factor (SCO1/SenC/PrrC family)